MGARPIDGWTALALGAMAGGAARARVTPAALPSELAAALAGRLPGIGGRLRTWAVTTPDAGQPEDPAADPGTETTAGPVAWVCTGAEAPDLLRRLARDGEVEQSYGRGTMQAAVAAGVRTTLAARTVVVSLPPSPGLTGVLAAPGVPYLWAPGSSRMAYRLAAAACREAAAGRGPCYILLDGELPPETVAVEAGQVPGQEAPMVRTGPEGRTPEVAPGDLLAAVARAPTASELLPFHHAGPDDPDLLLVGTGTTFGELARARTELLALGRQVAHLHVRQLRPLPVELLHPIWTSARTVVVQEAPGGGLAPYLRGALPGGRAPVVVPNLDQLAATLHRLHEALPPPAARAEPGHWPEVPAAKRPPLPPAPDHTHPARKAGPHIGDGAPPPGGLPGPPAYGPGGG